MCGEIEDDKHFDEELMARLLYIARGYGVNSETLVPRSGPPLSNDADRPAYMAELFRRILNHVVSDLPVVPEGLRADTVANQAIVLARLAGFLAGQLPSDSEMTRATMEALLDGHAEPARMFARLRREDHGHEHDHDHDHDHSHH